MKRTEDRILTQGKIPGHIWDQQFAWVKGYILALEDILGDVDLMSYDKYTLDRVRETVTRTLTQARATLASLEQMKDEG